MDQVPHDRKTDKILSENPDNKKDFAILNLLRNLN